MRQHKILTWTLLILSISYFALAAPVAVGKRPEKRGDPLDKTGSTNVQWPGQGPPPSLYSTSWEELMRTHGMAEQMPVAGSISPPPPPKSGSTNVLWPGHGPPPSLYSTSWEELMRTYGMAGQTSVAGSLSAPSPPPESGSKNGPRPDHAPPNPGSPSGSRLPVVVASLSPPPSAPPTSPHPSQPGPSQDYFPRPPGFSVNPDTSSSTGSTGNRPTSPQGPGVNSEIHPPLNPDIPAESNFWEKVLKDKIKRRIFGSEFRFLGFPRRRHGA